MKLVFAAPLYGDSEDRLGHALAASPLGDQVGLYPIVTFQYSATTLYQVSYHIQHLFF